MVRRINKHPNFQYLIVKEPVGNPHCPNHQGLYCGQLCLTFRYYVLQVLCQHFKNRNLLILLRILFYPYNPLDKNVEAFRGGLKKAQ